jgi:NADH-quinone oxidoreductase subunit E
MTAVGQIGRHTATFARQRDRSLTECGGRALAPAYGKKEDRKMTYFEPTELARTLAGNGHADGLLSVLEEIQSRYRYLPREAMILVSERLGVPLSQTYSVATFYHAFTLKPRGKYLIRVCLGTACHVRGSGRVLEKVSKLLNVEPGETTPDGLFTLETVNCLGACALGPIMVVENEYFGHMNASRVDAAVMKYTEAERQEQLQ